MDIIAVETPPDPDQRYARARVSEIAVVDNGEGMDSIILRRALKFGDGTRTDRQKRVLVALAWGFPNPRSHSVSGWTSGHGKTVPTTPSIAISTLMKSKLQGDRKCQNHCTPQSRTGGGVSRLTFLSRLGLWSYGATLIEFDGLEERKPSNGLRSFVGVFTRKFLTDSEVRINMLRASNKDDHLTVEDRQDCFPNDPLYLMTPSSTPEPFHIQPMFELFNERTWLVPVGEVQGEIHVRCAMARPDAINEAKSEITWPRSYRNPGDAPWGKHADRNKGVSIVRARRELELSLAWVNNYEPEERWWSVEVEFDPILDEMFGVVNNKQHAHAFVEGAGIKEEEMTDPGESLGAFRERLEETNDPKVYLIEVWNWIDDQIKRMRSERKEITKGTRTPRHPQTGQAARRRCDANYQRTKGERRDRN